MQRFANLLQAVFFKEPFEFTLIAKFGNRSEERRVGKECRAS